ncbi:MAG TPA: ATP-binding protein [Usitatibacter sp.]|nr:ATP-binding protein [Usitatibacter sp.]
MSARPAARGLPATLAGRVLLLLLAGLVLAHAASFGWFVLERGRALERLAAQDIAARIIELVRSPVTANLPREGAGGTAPRLRWRSVDRLAEKPAGTRRVSTRIESETRRLVAADLGADPIAWMARHDEPLVSVGLALADGRRIVARTLLFEDELPFPSEAWMSVLLLLAVTAAFSFWAVRLAVQPVRVLADAAERLSRNIAEPPLPERGPEELRAATRAFNRMRERLKRHVDGRTLAFAAMSHDLRTPLTRLRLRLESLPEKDRAAIEGDLAEVEGIAKSVVGLARELSPEEAVATVDLEALVRRLLDDYVPLGHHVALAGRCSPVQGRADALRRAIANLVDNALKYAGAAEVALSDEAGHSVVRVCDRGPGIPEEHLQRAMQPFHRVESSRSRDTGGSGLGLAIARDIAEGHGGELTLENRDGGGLCARLALPP